VGEDRGVGALENSSRRAMGSWRGKEGGGSLK